MLRVNVVHIVNVIRAKAGEPDAGVMAEFIPAYIPELKSVKYL